jgi:ankyrin repeat protein
MKSYYVSFIILGTILAISAGCKNDSARAGGMLGNALALLDDQKEEEAKRILEDILVKYPYTEVAAAAHGLLDTLRMEAENRRHDNETLLLAYGADINVRGEDGKTPLHRAVEEYYGGIELLDLLASKSADINAKDNDGMTPLHVATMNGNANCIQWLLAHGANVNAKNDHGWTPLFCINDDNMKESVELLLAKGADINARDYDGHTPLYWARYFDEKGLVALYLKRGAAEE